MWASEPLEKRGRADTQVRPYGQERAEIFVGRPMWPPASLPPTGGKVAFAKQMTDEGAKGKPSMTSVVTLISQPCG